MGSTHETREPTTKARRLDKSQIIEALTQSYFSDDPPEKETLERLPKILRSVNVFVDIGASLGQYTYHANKHMRGGRIVAVEADPIRFERLRDNCREWQSLSSNTIQALHAAISDDDGKTRFHYIPTAAVSGGLFRHDLSHVPADVRQAIQWEETFVDCFRLDTLLGNIRADLVKIDVEGSELRVLRGCRRTLEEGKARFLIEVHGWADPSGQKNAGEVFDFMKSFGYYPTNMYGRHLFAKRSKLRILLLWPETEMNRFLKCMARLMLPGFARRWLGGQLQRYQR